MEPASPPCLFYLFADRLLPREGQWRHAMGELAVPVPGCDTLVNLGHLEQHILAVALWDLDAAGVIRLRKDTSLRHGSFRVDRGDPVGSLPGLEGKLAEVLPAAGASLWDLVMGHWVTDRPMALNAIVVEAQVEALGLGLIDRPETPDLVPGLLGHHTFPTVAVHTGPLAQQRRPFEALSAFWSEAAKPGGLGADLLKACQAVLFDARPSFRRGTWAG